MHVWFTTQPAYGHLHPMVPLGRALIRAGHIVTAASSASFQPRLQSSGLGAAVAGVDWLESDIAAGFPEYSVHRARGDSKRYLQSEIFAWQTAQAMARDVVELAKTSRIDLIVREPWEFGGAVAAAALGVPCVVHGIGSLANVEEVVDLAAGRLRELGTDAGLNDDTLAWVGGVLYLDLCPPLLQPQGGGFRPRRVQALRPLPFDATDGAKAPPPWLGALGPRPVVYVGLGTVMNRWGDLLERILADLNQVDADVVVTTGPGRTPQDLGPQPDHVHIEKYLPLTTLFPRCDLVVCHAGWGTTIAALSHGLPLLTIPLGADGPRTAARCAAAGVGRSLEPDDIGRGALAPLVNEMLHDGRYRKAATRARHQIDDMPGTEKIVPLLEAVAA